MYILTYTTKDNIKQKLSLNSLEEAINYQILALLVFNNVSLEREKISN